MMWNLGYRLIGFLNKGYNMVHIILFWLYSLTLIDFLIINGLSWENEN